MSRCERMPPVRRRRIVAFLSLLLIAAGIVAALFNIVPLRRALLSAAIFKVFKRITPAMSTTEQEAINAGSVTNKRRMLLPAKALKIAEKAKFKRH